MDLNQDTQGISSKGKEIVVPAIRFGGVALVVTGKILKIAQIFDEDWLEARILPNPLEIIKKLRDEKNPPDIFTFTQRVPDVNPRYSYPFEWKNVAAAETESHSSWFDKQVDRSVRKHVRKSQKEGIIARVAPFDDRLVEAICSIYNEGKVRQGRQFWHYGKSFDQVKKENGTYLERSVFICAYYGDELVGFIKIVIDGPVATMMQILSKASHFSKRPNNALISKTIEVCEERKVKYLIYGEFNYGKKDESTLIDFKVKNGFKRIDYPQYYVPLTGKGRLAMKIGLHKGWVNMIPGPVMKSIVQLRSKYYAVRGGNSRGRTAEGQNEN
jgi:hypothetical protein